jgi:hypothetical protein
MENKGYGKEPMEEDHGGGQDPHRVVVSAKNNNFWRRVQIMELLVTRLYPPPVTSVPRNVEVSQHRPVHTFSTITRKYNLTTGDMQTRLHT